MGLGLKPLGDPKYLDKKAPSSRQYQNVSTRTDTGMNMRKLIESHSGSGPNAHKKQKNEFFIRLRASTLGRLLEPLVDAEESVFGLANLAVDDGARSMVSSVPPSVRSHAEAGSSGGSGHPSEGNILLFDLRPFDDFQQCHIFGAKHYDVAMLNKSTNQFPREVYYFKGPPECPKMIVLYDEDGKSAVAAGNAFVERGVENTYVVSGGFLGVCDSCPSVLVGQPPSPQTLAELMARAGLKRAGAQGSGSGGGGSLRSDAGSVRCSTAGSVRTAVSSRRGGF